VLVIRYGHTRFPYHDGEEDAERRSDRTPGGG